MQQAVLEKPLLRSELRFVQPGDNAALANIIRTVLPEFGATGPGYAIADPEVDYMCETYAAPRSRYFVVEQDGMVLGGGGVAPLKAASPEICELQKFYLVKEARGTGMGQRIIDACFGAAREFGFKHCYIETLLGMEAALTLYARNGFVHLSGPLGGTGHYKCQAWMVKAL